jgi:hypothetical protein
MNRKKMKENERIGKNSCLKPKVCTDWLLVAHQLCLQLPQQQQEIQKKNCK